MMNRAKASLLLVVVAILGAGIAWRWQRDGGQAAHDPARQTPVLEPLQSAQPPAQRAAQAGSQPLGEIFRARAQEARKAWLQNTPPELRAKQQATAQREFDQAESEIRSHAAQRAASAASEVMPAKN